MITPNLDSMIKQNRLVEVYLLLCEAGDKWLAADNALQEASVASTEPTKAHPQDATPTGSQGKAEVS